MKTNEHGSQPGPAWPDGVVIRKSAHGDGPVRVWWPCAVSLASAGSMRELREVTSLIALLEASGLARTFDMTVTEVLWVLLENDTFDTSRPEIGGRLARLAAAADVTPTVMLRCHLMTALHR
jgi:hypothetical protein